MKRVPRAALWTVAIIIALPLLPLAVSLCAGGAIASAAVDKDDRTRRGAIIGGVVVILILLLFSVIGLFAMYELIRVLLPLIRRT